MPENKTEKLTGSSVKDRTATHHPIAIETSEAFKVAKETLSTTLDDLCTKVTSSHSDLLEIPRYEDLDPRLDETNKTRFQHRLEATTSIEDLLALERSVMMQIERLEAAQRALADTKDATEIRSKASEMAAQADAVFDSIMADVKKKDRPIETQVQSFRAFLLESGVSVDPDKAQYIYVLNVDPKALPALSEFGEGENFGPIDGLRMIHQSVYGLWVLGTKARSSDEVASIGSKALQHTAVAVMNLDSEENVDRSKRRDPRGFRLRNPTVERGATQAEIEAADSQRTPLKEKDIDWIDGVLSNKEGTERVVLCFSPVRVRKETYYEALNDLGDVTIPSSYIYGGKLFFVSMVSKKEGPATSVSRVDNRFGIGSYALVGSGADYGPFLYDFEGHTDSIEKRPVIAGMLSTGVASEQEMKRSIDHFSGQHTSAGKNLDNQIPVVLSYEYLRRIMTLVGRGIQGQPLANRAKIRDSVEALLQKNLMGTDARMPFESIRVDDDSSSSEAQELNKNGGIRLVVKAKAKKVIVDVAVAIMPPAE